MAFCLQMYGSTSLSNRSMYRNFNLISQHALKKLDTAKLKLRDFILDANIPSPTKPATEKKRKTKQKQKKPTISEEIITFHLVGEARTRFKKHLAKVAGPTAKCRFRKVPREEQNQIAKYKKRKGAIYFGSVTIDQDAIDYFIENSDQEFQDRLHENEQIYGQWLYDIGVPLQDCGGWLKKGLKPVMKSQANGPPPRLEAFENPRVKRRRLCY